MRTHRIVGAAASAVALVLLTSPVAHAADARLPAYYGGTLRAVGTWDDSHDTICVRTHNSPGSYANATIWPADGTGPSFGVGGGSSLSCTGNLSIPEDERYILRVQWFSADNQVQVEPPAVYFYT